MEVYRELDIKEMETDRIPVSCLDAIMHKDRPAHWGKLLYGLIHNMNGPLQNMTMLVDMIDVGRAGATPPVLNGSKSEATRVTDAEEKAEKQKKRLKQLAQQIQTLTSMLQDFMALDSMEQSEMETDLRLLINRLVSVYRANLFFKHNVNLELQLNEEIPRVKIPGRVLVPSFMHILDNSMAALKEAREKTLRIQCRREEGAILVIFSDTGCGLPPEAATDGFFTPLRNLAQSPSPYAHPDKRHRHFGLGLYTVCHLLDPYGVRVALAWDGMETSTILKIPSIW